MWLQVCVVSCRAARAVWFGICFHVSFVDRYFRVSYKYSSIALVYTEWSMVLLRNQFVEHVNSCLLRCATGEG